MKTAVLALVAGLLSYALVRSALSRERAEADRATARGHEQRVAGPVEGGSPWSNGFVPRRVLQSPQADPSTADRLTALRQQDPAAASLLAEGVDRAMFRLLQQAVERRAGVERPTLAECLPAGDDRDVLTVTFAVTASPDQLVVADAAATEDGLDDHGEQCVRAWLAGAGEVTDEEIGGPFPELRFRLDRVLPVALGDYVAE